MIRVGSALSTIDETEVAARDCMKRALDGLNGERPDLVVSFHSPHHVARIEDLAAVVWEESAGAVHAGITTETAVGEGREYEGGPGISVWAAHLGRASASPFAISIVESAEGRMVAGLPTIDDETKALILLADPFSFPSPLLGEIGAGHPGMPVVGGMASGGSGPGEHALIVNDAVASAAAVGAELRGPLRVETLVSQGCKPIGDPYVVTEAKDNIIRSLDGRPAMECLRRVFSTIGTDEMGAPRPIHLGIAIDPSRTHPGQGDFLIRSVIGADEQSGAIAIGDYIEEGRIVQFHLRDAEAADEEFKALLTRTRSDWPNPAGALMFTCNGRGIRLFGMPHHDAQAVESAFGPLPMAGMFCNGEIGPVGGRPFLHGFTASLAFLLEENVSRASE